MSAKGATDNVDGAMQAARSKVLLMGKSGSGRQHQHLQQRFLKMLLLQERHP
jgi:hypothetical protein